MKRLIFPILVIFIGYTGLAFSQSWVPNKEDIAKVEASVRLDQLPYWKTSKLPSLAGYERYYAGSTLDGEKVIFGELVAPFNSKQQPGVHVTATKREFPVIFDGGCAIVSLMYSVKEQKILSIKCNGFA